MSVGWNSSAGRPLRKVRW